MGILVNSTLGVSQAHMTRFRRFRNVSRLERGIISNHKSTVHQSYPTQFPSTRSEEIHLKNVFQRFGRTFV